MKIFHLATGFFFALLLMGCASTLKLDRALKLSYDDRTTLGGSISRNNFVNSDIKFPIEKIWDFYGSGGISSNQPLISDSILFTGFMNGELLAINIQNGKKLGRVSTDGAIHAAPVLLKDRLFLASAHSKYSLKAFDFNDGIIIWKKEIEGIESSLLFIDNVLYTATESGNLLAINPSNGKNLWEQKFPKKIRSSLAGDKSKIYFGCDDGYLYAVDKADGKIIWKFFTSAAISGTPALDNSGNIYIGSIDHYFYCVDIDSGFMKWKFNSGSEIQSGSAIDENNVYFGNLSGHFYALDKKNGNVIWKYKSKGIFNTSPTVTNNHVVTGSFDKNVYIMDKHNGKIVWEHEFEGRIKTTPVIWRNYLIICSEDYEINLFKF